MVAPRLIAANDLAPGGIARIIKPNGLRRWQAAFDDRWQNSPLIMVAGDSQVAGVGYDDTTNVPTEEAADQYSYAGILRRLFAQATGTNECGFIKTQPQSTDSRVVAAGATASSSYGLGSFTRYINNTSNSGSAGTFTIAAPKCDAIDVINYESLNTTSLGGVFEVTSGNFSVTIDGGSATNFNHTGQGGAYLRKTVSGLSNATHSIVITATSAGNVLTQGLIYRSAGGIIVGRVGRSGWTAADYMGQAGNNSISSVLARDRILRGFAMGNPNLVIIELGHNDCVQQLTGGFLTTVSDYSSRITQFCQTVVNAGGCVLLLSSPYPSYAEPTGGSTFKAYHDAAEAVALSMDHVAHIRMPYLWGTNAQAQDLGYHATGSVHSSKKGNGSRANWLFRLLTQRDFGNLAA